MEKIKQPKTLISPHLRTVRFKEVKENALASEGKSSIMLTRNKINMRVMTSHNETSSKNHSLLSQHVDPSKAQSTHNRKYSLEQAAFWHEVKVVCCLPTCFLHSRLLTFA